MFIYKWNYPAIYTTTVDVAIVMIKSFICAKLLHGSSFSNIWTWLDKTSIVTVLLWDLASYENKIFSRLIHNENKYAVWYKVANN